VIPASTPSAPGLRDAVQSLPPQAKGKHTQRDAGITDVDEVTGEADAGRRSRAERRTARRRDSYLLAALRSKYARGANASVGVNGADHRGFSSSLVGSGAGPAGPRGWGLRDGDAVLDPDLVPACVDKIAGAPPAMGRIGAGWTDVARRRRPFGQETGKGTRCRSGRGRLQQAPLQHQHRSGYASRRCFAVC